MNNNPDKMLLKERLQAVLYGTDSLFDGLSNLREYINRHYPRLEFYQEDLWNERVTGETHLDSILRCKKTLYETEPFAYDIYANHRDSFGVWHLDDYRETILLCQDTSMLVDFIFQHAAQPA